LFYYGSINVFAIIKLLQNMPLKYISVLIEFSSP